MTTIKYAASGEQRKKLVNALSEILECESKYLKAPSYGYEVGSCVVNRTGDIEFPDDMTEEEIEAIVKKLTWHGFERVLDEPTGEIDGAPALEESALGAEDPTEENVSDAVEANVEESEDVLDETVVEEGKIAAAEDSAASKETSAESIEESEAPVLPEGNFESAEATKEATGEPSEETSIPEATEPKKIVIELPGSYLDEAELGRVRAIVASKASVLKKLLKRTIYPLSAMRIRFVFHGSLTMASMAKLKHICSLCPVLRKELKCLLALQLQRASRKTINLRCGSFLCP